VTGAVRQLEALLLLRWQMLRTPGAKAGAVACALLLGWLLRVAVASDDLIGDAAVATALEIAPGAFLGFGVLALVAPLTAGGGHEVVPSEQLTAFPVRPATQFLGGLTLAPANLVWVVQLLVLTGLTGYLAVGGNLWLAGLTTAAFVVCLTVVGQALAWTVVGLRQSRRGRRVVVGAALLLVVTVVITLETSTLHVVLDEGPAPWVVLGVIAGSATDIGAWLPVTAALVVVAAVAAVAGVRACGWALRRPGDLGAGHTGEVRRRAARRGHLRELVAVDRASAWRAPALRRGALVILVLPGVVAATFQVPWESLVVLPGLVAAGAGLLFGVNAFALDAAGALWLASQPVDPVLLLKSKLVVISETVLAAVAAAALAGALRSEQPPTSAQLSAMAAAALACSAVVVALCLRASVRRPHHADLRGPRDAIAPPGALAVASARLAGPCAFVAVAVAASSQTGSAVLPVLVAVPFALLALLSVLRSVRFYADPARRAAIVHAVATG
jgi:hypothetical protein